MMKQATPIAKGSTHTIPGDAYVRYSMKALYISAAAAIMLPAHRIRIHVDAKKHVMVIEPTAETEGSFKLSHVCESRAARRVETNNALLSILQAGFPIGMLRKRLPCQKGLDGSLVVNLLPQIVTIEPRKGIDYGLD